MNLTPMTSSFCHSIVIPCGQLFVKSYELSPKQLNCKASSGNYFYVCLLEFKICRLTDQQVIYVSNIIHSMTPYIAHWQEKGHFACCGIIPTLDDCILSGLYTNQFEVIIHSANVQTNRILSVTATFKQVLHQTNPTIKGKRFSYHERPLYHPGACPEVEQFNSPRSSSCSPTPHHWVINPLNDCRR